MCLDCIMSVHVPINIDMFFRIFFSIAFIFDGFFRIASEKFIFIVQPIGMYL